MADAQEKPKAGAQIAQNLSKHLTISRDQTSTSRNSEEKLLALAKVAAIGEKDVTWTDNNPGGLNSAKTYFLEIPQHRYGVQGSSLENFDPIPYSGDRNDPNLPEDFDFEQSLQGDRYQSSRINFDDTAAESLNSSATPKATDFELARSDEDDSRSSQRLNASPNLAIKQRVKSLVFPSSSFAAKDYERQQHQWQQFSVKKRKVEHQSDDSNSSGIDFLGSYSPAPFSSYKKRAGSLGTMASNGLHDDRYSRPSRVTFTSTQERTGADSPNKKGNEVTRKEDESEYLLTHSSSKDVAETKNSIPEYIDASNRHDAISSKLDSIASLEFTGEGRPNANASRHGVDMSATSDLLSRLKSLENENLALKSKKPAERTTWITFYCLEETTYLEQPQWRTAENELILRADMPIRNDAVYLEQHPEIIFAVYKSYDSHPPAPRTLSNMQDGILSAPEPCAESLKLISQHLISSVTKLSRMLPDFQRLFPNFDYSQRVRIPAPYIFLYYLKPLLSSVEPSLTSNESHVLQKLVSCIRASHGQEHDDATQCFSEGVVTMRLMQYLIRPGDILVYGADPARPAYMSTTCASKMSPPKTNPGNLEYLHDLEYLSESEALDAEDEISSKSILEEHTSSQPHNKTSYCCTVSAWTWVFDGFFQRKKESLSIQMKIADKDEKFRIKSLNIFPLRFDDGEIGTRLKKRGKTFWKCRTARLVSHQEDEHTALTSMYDRYMIDVHTYKTLHPDSFIARSAFRADISDDAMASNEPPKGKSVFLFPPTIIGYNLRLKRWVDLSVDRISEVVWNKKAFDDLVVNSKTKELVKALVTSRVTGEESTDIIQGKGNGLIVLLHGAPGTGKTFTAEGVAEMAEKPLYRVTCGDVGTKPEEVEKYLESVLHLGNIWDCVVLLDEADVFLEERGLSDLQRNALVSVFLRVLEYNVGILILTSNRVGSFDEAFKSRIHLALYYENLTTPQQRKIWRNFLDRLQKLDEGKIDYNDITDHIDDLSQQNMNGRQIRNSITIARQLARYQGKRLSYDHLKHVMEVGGEFETYLSKLQEGFSDDQIKRDGGLR